MTTPDPGWWGVAEAAAHCGLTPGAWRRYVHDGHAPRPDDPDEDTTPNRRTPRWRPETVTTWHATRNRKPGRPRKTTT